MLSINKQTNKTITITTTTKTKNKKPPPKLKNLKQVKQIYNILSFLCLSSWFGEGCEIYEGKSF